MITARGRESTDLGLCAMYSNEVLDREVGDRESHGGQLIPEIDFFGLDWFNQSSLRTIKFISSRRCLRGRGWSFSTSSTSPARGRFFHGRKAGAFSDNVHKMQKQRVIAICAIKAVISIGPTCDQASGAEPGQFFLNCAQSQSTHGHQLADITLPCWIGEKQPQDLCAHFGKQNVQDCRRSFHQSA